MTTAQENYEAIRNAYLAAMATLTDLNSRLNKARRSPRLHGIEAIDALEDMRVAVVGRTREIGYQVTAARRAAAEERALALQKTKNATTFMETFYEVAKRRLTGEQFAEIKAEANRVYHDA